MRIVPFLLIITLCFSCTAKQENAAQNGNISIQRIIDQWTEIDMLFNGMPSTDIRTALADTELLKQASKDFSVSMQIFIKSDLYRTYKAIPYSSKTKRSFRVYPASDVEEVQYIADSAVRFRDSIISGDEESAKFYFDHISRCLIKLLIIDVEAQMYVSSSHFYLLIAFVFFFAIIIMLIIFMNKSLTSSIKRETEATVFSHSYMLAQDEERARISRELHDTVIQDMRCVLIGNEETAPKMADLIKKTRDICNSLIPPDFRFSELPDALRQLCHDFNEKTKIECRAEIDASLKLEFFTMEKRLQVYRIVQEALTNIEKHAEAKEVIVTMRQSNNIIYIGIDDDGKGFNSPLDDSGQIIGKLNKSNIGIISMKERAAILGGRIKIVSEIGEGTLVCLEIPGNFNTETRINTN